MGRWSSLVGYELARQNSYGFRAISSWVTISADFQNKRISKETSFEAKLTFLVFFWPRRLLISKTALIMIEDLSIGYQLPKGQNLCQIPYGFRSIKKFILEPVFHFSNSISKSCFNLTKNRVVDTLVITDHF